MAHENPWIVRKVDGVAKPTSSEHGCIQLTFLRAFKRSPAGVDVLQLPPPHLGRGQPTLKHPF